jgi:hypothetical protein
MTYGNRMQLLKKRSDRLIRRQHGAIARHQALDLGFSPDAITRLVVSGQWIAIFSGVYRVAGAPITQQQMLWAVQLWAREGAFSGRCAARLHGFDGADDRGIEITIPHNSKSPSRLITVRHSEYWDRDGIEAIDGLRVMPVLPTLVTYAARSTDRMVGIALDGLVRDGRVTMTSVREYVDRVGGPGVCGIGRMRRILARRPADNTVVHSALEYDFEPILSDPRLPPYVPQHRVVLPNGRTGRPDFAYPEFKTGVEIQSRRWHTGLEHWHRDVERQNLFAAVGWMLLQFVSEDRQRPDYVVRTVLAALEARGYGPS